MRPLSLLAGLALVLASVPPALADPATPPRSPAPPELAPRRAAAPTVTITPGGGSWSGTAAQLSLPVTIEWCNDQGLDAASRNVSLNGQTVTSGFSYTTGTKSGCGAYAVSRDTLLLSPGTHTLSAYIFETQGSPEPLDGFATVAFTYSLAPAGPGPVTVSVTPESGAAAPGAGERPTQPFTVTNTGTQAAVFVLGAACSGAATGCAATPARVEVAPGASAMAGVSYAASSTVGDAGTVRLWAAQEGVPAVADTSAVQVTTAAVPDAGTLMGTGDRTRLDRDACLTLAMGPAAALECVDLRITHALPSTRVLNQLRTPVLLFNSQHARPFPLVALEVAPRAGTRPDSVRLTLRLTADGSTFTRTVPGWPSDSVKRVGIGFSAAGRGLGVLDYTLTVTALWNGGAAETLDTRSGRLGVVDRRASPFGAGWWMAGLEQLVPHDGSTLFWVGGDGSQRLYRPVAGTTDRWAAETFDRPDTLVLRTHAVADSIRYVRILPGRAEVRFDTRGRHRETVNALGHVTIFWYDAYDRLRFIYWPVTGHSYDFRYPAPGAPLAEVAAPGPAAGTERVTRVETDALRRVLSITDPDSSVVRFGYANAGSLTVSRRTDREGAATSYLYDAVGQLYRSLTAFPDPADSIVVSVLNPQGLGVATGPWPAQSVHGYVDGPRKDVWDVTYLWLNRFGAPVKITDPLSHSTTVTYGDRRFPGLATRVRHPDGRETSASYDARGNPESVTDWSTVASHGRPATTLYRWDPHWDRVVQTTLPEGESTHTGLDARGRSAWVQPGPDSLRRTRFVYHPDDHPNAPGMVERTLAPGIAPERYDYDGAGNLRRVTSPLGRWSETLRDRVGRDTLARSQIDGAYALAEAVTYDLADRPRLRETRAPALPHAPAQTLSVRTGYDREGRVTSVSRGSTPDSLAIGVVTTRWAYDRAGRVVTEYAPDGARDSTVYDPAGNAVRVLTRRGDTLTMVYDALNRLTKRRVPAVTYAPRSEGMARVRAGAPLAGLPYPYFPTAADGLGYHVPADSATFTYDAMGRLRTAVNRDAAIRRTYWPNGLLKDDTLHVRTVAEMGAGGSMVAHVYTLRHAYDLNGRRVELDHPDSLAPVRGGVVRDRTTYAYHPHTGAIQRITDPLGNAFGFRFDARGDLDTLYAPGGVTQVFAHDDDGRRTFHGVVRGAGWLRHETFRHQADGRLTFSGSLYGNADTLTVRYTGLGHLFHSSHGHRGTTPGTGLPVRYVENEHPRGDALANLGTRLRDQWLLETDGMQRIQSSVRSYFAYQPGTGRLLLQTLENQVDTTRYDAAGNVVFTTQAPAGADAPGPAIDRASFYDAEGRLRAVDHRVREDARAPGARTWIVFEDYRYDPLGRRVWARTRRACENDGQMGDFRCRHHLLRRTVWDGDQELYEIQMPADEPAEENDTGFAPQKGRYDNGWDPNPYFGRVLYTSGLGIDQPLGIIRMKLATATSGQPYATWDDFALVPLWSSRGQVDRATFEDGADARCKPVQGTTVCVPNDWPGGWFPYNPVPAAPPHWHGTLAVSKADGSGLLFRRNRYYDPQSGRFTQEDPIGIAGGLNVYGFAGGDPVNFADPYGLRATCPDRVKRGEKCEEDRGEDGILERHGRCEVARTLTNYIAALRRNPIDFVAGAYPGEFDFKFGGRSDDLFQVGKRWLRADEFGNFAAGYAGQHAWAEAGHFTMIVGGIWFALEKGSGEHWFDGDSRPMINAGAARARLEQARDGRPRGMRGVGVVNPGYVPPLTNTAGCK